MSSPPHLRGVVVRGGRALGVDLPALAERDAVFAWHDVLEGPALYVRFADRGEVPSVKLVQRLSRLGSLWLDCKVRDADAALDLLVSGAARLVLWPAELGEGADELLDAVAESALLGWDGTSPWDGTCAKAKGLGAAILCTREPPEGGDADAYLVDLGAAPPLELVRIRVGHEGESE